MRVLRRRCDGFGVHFIREAETLRSVFVGVGEDAHPIEFGGADEIAELAEIVFGFAGEADDERGAQETPGIVLRTRSSIFRKASPFEPRFMRARTPRLACCSGTSRYFARRGCAAMVSSSRGVMRLG